MGKRIEMEAAEKEYLIQECLAGRMREAARRAGVGHSTMHTWISRYRSEGASALCENGNAQRRTYSEEIRQKAVEEYLSGQGSSMAIAEKYKLRSGNLVLDWVKEYHRHRESLKGTGGVPVARGKHTLEERVQAVREHLEDRRGKRLASQTPRTSEEALRIENARLERENYLLKMELDLLKKVKELERGDR